MNLYKIGFILALTPITLFAKIDLYGDLKGIFNDSEFKKIFSDDGICACIWVQEYRRNLVYEGKVSKETDIVMHNRCTEAALSVAEKTEYSIEPIYIDLRHTGKAPDFSNPMKQRYKQLFPQWKQVMKKELEAADNKAKTEYICDTTNQQGLDECTKNLGKSENKKNSNNTLNSLKSFTHIFN